MEEVSAQYFKEPYIGHGKEFGFYPSQNETLHGIKTTNLDL